MLFRLNLPVYKVISFSRPVLINELYVLGKLVCVCVCVCVNRVSQNQRSRIQPYRGLRATLSFRDRPVSAFRQILMTCG